MYKGKLEESRREMSSLRAELDAVRSELDARQRRLAEQADKVPYFDHRYSHVRKP